jgi:hypothetical protein
MRFVDLSYLSKIDQTEFRLHSRYGHKLDRKMLTMLQKY